MRRLFVFSSALVLVFLATGLLLPADYEIRRTRALDAPRAVLHSWLAEPQRRARWAPDWLVHGAPVTASLAERGVWWDVSGVGPRGARSAALYAGSGGTHLTWLLRVPVGRDPVRRWLALAGSRRRAREMEAALTRLEACLVQLRDP